MTRPLNVLITGCSSGIGLELMKRLARPKSAFRIFATALPNSLESLLEQDVIAQENVSAHALDVTNYQEATSLVSRIVSEHGPIDILVNNAGVSYRSVVEDMNLDDEQFQFAVNYFGPMHLIRLCLPGMREKRQGKIINVSSVGGMMAMPTMASYSASKFALEGASEALWYEMKPWNIQVSLVRPGFINSLAFTKVHYSRSKSAGKSSSEYAKHYSEMTNFVEKIMKRTPCKSENVARRIEKLIHSPNPPLRSSGTPDASLFRALRRLLPRWLYHKLLYRSLPNIESWGPPRK